MGGISIWQLVIILAIILLIFMTKKLRNLGSDLGGAFKGFKDAMDDGKNDSDKPQIAENKDDGNTFDVKAEKVSNEEKS